MKTDHLSPKVARALQAAIDDLDSKGIAYTVIGGIAVGQYGYERNTSDVDFLLGDDAYDKGFIVTFKKPMPLKIEGVAVDYLSIEDGEDFLRPEIGTAYVSLPALMYMKLKANRFKDQADVVELVKAGADLDEIEHYLERNLPELVAHRFVNRLRNLVRKASGER